MKAALTLHLLALGACFVVQSGALELSGIPGIRRALQTMDARAEPLPQRIKLRFPTVTAAGDLPW
ncbi:hypothetical protein MES4922_20181 [Mesorhizobium ventifaucium]|uniref:Uncharacterized protein n=1 Tax=Mesorhizobium ventifaucium TaxID=666020 RepID=A0ABN8JKC4_9HYPH|nr:hypothetical protein MES4922_20181 [Mesorhizobium ventifaucium]